MASGTDTTLNMLEDPERRPPTPIIEIPREMMEHWPVEDFALDLDKFARTFVQPGKVQHQGHLA